ncbi:MAG: hypothetical protein HXK87_04210 [Lachnospiraceae bacterium]|nr:hypothetical protein [Lachnospiraceae bacterium]
MKKEEYKERAMRIRSLADEQKFKAAADLADSIDWSRVRSVKMLGLVSDIYKAIRRYKDSRDIMLLAYQHAPEDSKLVYYLCELDLKLGDFIGAMECYKEFVRLAPQDAGRYILQYKIYEAQDVSLEERASVLEELKKHNYIPKWGYELAYLYHRMGMESACVAQCDEMAAWFCRGSYVVKALELKNLHAPLSKEQYDILAREKPGTYFGRPDDFESGMRQEKDERMQPRSTLQPPLRNAQESRIGRFRDYQGFVAPAGSSRTGAGWQVPDQSWDTGIEETEDRNWTGAGQQIVDSSWEGVEQKTDGQGSETEETENTNQGTIGQEEVERKQSTLPYEPEPIETANEPVQLPDNELPELLPGSRSSGQQPGIDQSTGKSPQISEEQWLDSLLAQRTAMPQQQETNGHFDEMLEMDGDGQMSLLVPEGEPEEEQVTGQISIDDIMAKLREENETKVEERVSQIVHGRTDGMFHSFERSVREEHDFFAGGVIRPEKTEKNVIHPTGNIVPFAYSGSSETAAANALEAIARQAALDAEHSASVSERMQNSFSQETEESLSVQNSEAESLSENDRRGDEEKTEQSATIHAEKLPVDGDIDQLPEEKQSSDTDHLLEEKNSDTDQLMDREPDQDTISQEASQDDSEEESAEDDSEEEPAEEATDGGETEEVPTEKTEGEVLGQEKSEAEEEPEIVSEGLPEKIGESESEELQEENSEALQEDSSEVLQEESSEGTSEELQEDNPEGISEETPDEEAEEETAEEIKEEAAQGQNVPRSEKAKHKHKRRKDKEEGRATVSAGNVAERIKGLSEQEKKLYGKFLHNHDTCNQIVLAIDALSADPSMGNAAVTGKDDEETLNLAQGLIRSIAIHNENFSGRVAKIKGDTLPAVQTEEFLEQLENGAMIITGASRLTRDTRKELIRVLSEKKKHVLVILIDTQKHIVDLLNRNPALRDLFHVQVNAERLNVEGLVAYGREYAREREYAIDHMGILALHSRIEELQTYDHQVTTEEVMNIVDEAIEKRDRRNFSKLFDTLSHKLYDEDDMIILGEKNFLP